MNKRDFYKELMKEYTFDSAKVRRNAKRSSFRRITIKRWWHVPSTVAVAAVALTVGLFALVYSSNNGGSPIVRGNERIIRANTAVEEVVSSIGNKTMYLSFNNSITFNEMQKALDSVSDTDIVVETIYIFEGNDNTVVSILIHEESGSITNELDSLKNDKTARIIGAKVYAPAVLIENLNRQQEVALLEFETEDINDETFVPLVVDLIEESRTSYEPVKEDETEPPATAVPVTDVETPITTAPESDYTSEETTAATTIDVSETRAEDATMTPNE